MCRDGIDHFEEVRDFMLGQKVYLQIQIRAFVGNRACPVLTDEHECGEEDRFQGDYQCQQAKRERIEWRPPEPAQIERDPKAEPDSVDIDEGHTSRKDRQRISDSVLKALLALFFSAHLNNRANILPYDTSYSLTLKGAGFGRPRDLI